MDRARAEPSPTSWRAWPKRDLILFPVVAIVTLLVLFIPAELIARWAYPAVEVDRCAMPQSAESFHERPNCRSSMRTPEGVWAESRFNACGFRTPEHCGPKPPGTVRVAILGSSTAAGYLTPYADSMAARASAALTRRCGRAVEFQNLAAQGNWGARLVASTRAALALRSDAIVLVISPFDLESADAARPGGKNALRQRRYQLSSSRLLYMESYVFLRSDPVYLPIFLNSGTSADFMRAPLSPPWQRHVSVFGTTLRDIAMSAKQRGVPLHVLFVPQRAQQALAAGDPVPGIQPSLLPTTLRTIVERNGAVFKDLTGDFPRRSSSDTYFYAVNGHINGAGHAVAGHAIATSLRHGAPFSDICH